MLNFFLKYKKIFIVLGLMLIGGIIFFYISLNDMKVKSLNEEEPIIKMADIIKDEIVEEEEIEPKALYCVDIKGAIKNPDVYCVKEGNRIIDIIELAGGLTKEADISVLNLSKKIKDEMVIIIYTKNEIKKFKTKAMNDSISEIIKTIDNTNNCPDPNINHGCIDHNSNNNNSNNKISINEADVNLLQTLPGIGEAKALAIIEYRNTNGPFKTIEDIKNVSGIGDSIFDQIKDYITV